jgi:hypothetical protein
MRPIRRFELVSLIIPANNTSLRIPFPDIPQLRSDTTQDVIIRGLEVYSAESMPNDPNNNPLPTNAQLLKTFLTFYIQQEESVKFIPSVKMLNIYNAASAAAYFYTDELVQAENWMVDWTKSSLNLASSLGNAGLLVFVLGVMYQRLPGGTIARLQAKSNPANDKTFQGDWYAGNQ